MAPSPDAFDFKRLPATLALAAVLLLAIGGCSLNRCQTGSTSVQGMDGSTEDVPVYAPYACARQ